MKSRKIRKIVMLFLKVLIAILLIGYFMILIIQLKQFNEDVLVYPESETHMEEIDGESISEDKNLSEVEAASDSKVQLEKQPETVDGEQSETGTSETEELAEEDIPREFTIAFGGDVLLDDNYSPMVALKKRDYKIESCFSETLLNEMRTADLLMINNEFPYTNRGEPTKDKTYTFRANPENVSYLKDMGVDLVTIANNHAYDFGEISLLDTISTLKEAEIPFVGAGEDLEEARKPYYYKQGGKTIAIIGTTQIERFKNPDTKAATPERAGVFRSMEVEVLLETIKEAKEQSDYVIVYIHWGTENEWDIDWAQKTYAPQIAEAGADFIIGSHAHILQPIGYYGDTTIVYGLGNFWFNSKTMDTCLLKLTFPIEKEPYLELIPARQENNKTVHLTGVDRIAWYDYMMSISPEIQLDENGRVFRK